MLYIIRAVPERQKDHHDYLRERLPEAQWVVEEASERSAVTFSRTLVRALRAQGNLGAVHLDDDVILTRDFQSKVARAVGPFWQHVVQLFSMRKEHDAGPKWESGRTFCHNQAMYVPGSLAPALADCQEDAIERGLGGAKSFDEDGLRMDQGFAIGAYLSRRGLKYRVHSPSLVQHRCEGSTLGHGQNRFPDGRLWQSRTFTDPWE